MESTNAWDHWTPTDAPEIDYVWAPADADWWQSGPWPHLESLDLGLAEASGGSIGAQRVRVAGGDALADTGWHWHDGDFDFLYILSGSLEIETHGGDHYTLGTGATACLPTRCRHREYGRSPDLEYVHITVPGTPATFVAGDGIPYEPEAVPTFTFDTPESYELGAGPRSFFNYRDLGTGRLTDGRIFIHVVRATEPGPGTGWHYHTMAQWFLILGGSSVIRVEHRPKQELNVLDSMCIGRGPNMRHNVAPYSGDYAVLEMCVPAAYETIPVAVPDSADAAPAGVME